MGIAFDAASSINISSVSSATFSHTVGDIENGVLVVAAYSMSSVGTRTISGVTYDGVAMTKMRADQGYDATYKYVETSLWILHNPPEGAHNVVITPAASAYVGGVAASYSGCKQVSSADAANGASGGTESGEKTVSVTTIADNCWVVAACGVRCTSSATVTPGQTERGSSIDSGSYYYLSMEDSNGAKTPAGARAMTYTLAASTKVWSFCVVSIAPYTGEAPAQSPVPRIMNHIRRSLS